MILLSSSPSCILISSVSAHSFFLSLHCCFSLCRPHTPFVWFWCLPLHRPLSPFSLPCSLPVHCPLIPFSLPCCLPLYRPHTPFSWLCCQPLHRLLIPLSLPCSLPRRRHSKYLRVKDKVKYAHISMTRRPAAWRGRRRGGGALTTRPDAPHPSIKRAPANFGASPQVFF